MRYLRGLLLLAAIGCSHTQRTHVDGGVLGRVVIYRNGVAFYERTASVHDGRVTVRGAALLAEATAGDGVTGR